MSSLLHPVDRDIDTQAGWHAERCEAALQALSPGDDHSVAAEQFAAFRVEEAETWRKTAC